MSHAPHVSPYRVLSDYCDECFDRSSTLEGLAELDTDNIRELAALAAEKFDMPDVLRPTQLGASYNDMRAVEVLLLAERIVNKSRIKEWVTS